MDPDLHVFDDGCDWYLAKNAEQAAELRSAFYGDESHDAGPFQQLPDDQKMTLLVDAYGERTDHGKLTATKTCAEWATLIGLPEMLCSRDI